MVKDFEEKLKDFPEKKTVDVSFQDIKNMKDADISCILIRILQEIALLDKRITELEK